MVPQLPHYREKSTFKLPHVIRSLFVLILKYTVDSLLGANIRWTGAFGLNRRWTATLESACALPMCMRTGCVCVGDVCQGSSWTFISRKFHPTLVHFECEAAKRENEEKKIWRFGNLIFSILSVGCVDWPCLRVFVLCCNRSDMLLWMFFFFSPFIFVVMVSEHISPLCRSA